MNKAKLVLGQAGEQSLEVDGIRKWCPRREAGVTCGTWCPMLLVVDDEYVAGKKSIHIRCATHLVVYTLEGK